MTADRRRPAARALGALALAALGACSGGSPGAGEQPYRHVVLITLDTLRADHLGCYGSEAGLTPRLDALAADGVRFADITTAAPTTLAAHVSIMTGTYAHTHAAARNGFEVAAENAMLAEVLRAAGFHTAAFLGSWALDRRFGFDQGFEHYDDRFEIAAGVAYEQDQRRAEQVTDAVLAHVDKTRAERRFLFVHYFDAHWPYDAPDAGAAPGAEPAHGAPRGSSLADVKRAVQRHQERFLDDPPGFDGTLVHGIPAEVLAGADGSALPEDEALKADYAREVAYLDVHVGRLLDGLRARGVLDRALVIVVADHGESFHEHADFWNHGLWVYDTTARVPCIVWRSPALRSADEAGRVVAAPVSTVDLAPTVLALAGLAPPAGIEGTSLVPALCGEPFERGPVFCEATQPIDPALEAGGWANRAKPRCVRSGPWKLVEAPLSGRTELFDLGADPGERADLSGDARQAAWTGELRRELERWSRAAAPKPSRGFNPEQSEELEQRLRALGYLGEQEETKETKTGGERR